MIVMLVQAQPTSCKLCHNNYQIHVPCLPDSVHTNVTTPSSMGPYVTIRILAKTPGSYNDYAGVCSRTLPS